MRHRSLIDLTLKDNYSDADDYVWSTWSDAKQRAYLVKEGVLDQAKAADLKRHELEDYLTKNYARSSSNWDTDSMRNYLKQKGLIKSDAEANAAQIKDLLCARERSTRLTPQHFQLRRCLEQEQ